MAKAGLPLGGASSVYCRRRHPIALQISVLGSGSSGNVTFVSNGSVSLLIDVGLTCREIERRLGSFGFPPSAIDGLLLSHEHQDHARGALHFARKHRCPLFATQGTFRGLRDRSTEKFKDIEWVRLKANRSLKLGQVTIDVFPTPHDAAEPVGFAVRHGRVRFSHVTDIGHVSRDVEEALRGSHAVLLESNHDVDMLRHGPYPDSLKQRVGSQWGHLSNEALARYLEERLPMSVRHLFLAHLSRTNNHETLALASCREALRRRGEPIPMVHLCYHDRPTHLLRLTEPRKVRVSGAQRVLAF